MFSIRIAECSPVRERAVRAVKTIKIELNEAIVLLIFIHAFLFQIIFCLRSERNDINISLKRYVCCFSFLSVSLDLISFLVFCFNFHSLLYRLRNNMSFIKYIISREKAIFVDLNSVITFLFQFLV